MALVPLNLFVTHRGKSSRQHVTCRHKCGDACSRPAPNTSSNDYFGDVVRQAVSRRSVLQAAGVTVLAVGTGSALAACSTQTPQNGTATTTSGEPAGAPSPGMNFASVAPNSADAVVIPDGYRQAVVISWGDPVLPGAPAFDVNAQSAAAQRQQFGFNNDFAGLLPIEGSPDRFLMVVNHEYTTEQFMYPGYDPDKPTREQFDTSVAAHGLSVVEMQRTPDGLTPVPGRHNRRITADTPFTLTGPAAGTDFVKTAADPTGRTVAGTLNNCSGGITPWGTVLSGEENFNNYFGAARDLIPRWRSRPDATLEQVTFPIRVGVQLQPQHAPDYNDIRDAVRRCEEMGVDVVFNWDHFFPLYGDPDGAHFECWTMLGAWAEQTSRVQIGALVTCNSYRNPELLADMARTVDHISGGRLILGIGSGWKRKDYAEYGYEFGTAGSRLDDLAAALPRIEARLAKLNPLPTRHIPLLIGGQGEKKTLRLVARHADIWHGFTTRATHPAKARILARHCAAVGRDPGTVERSSGVEGRDADALIAEAEALTGLGVALLTVGCDGPDYDLDAARTLCAWRDRR